jgi:hypothetical protein
MSLPEYQNQRPVLFRRRYVKFERFAGPVFVLEDRGMASTEPTAGERDNYRLLSMAMNEHRIISGTPPNEDTPPIGATRVAKLAAEAKAKIPAVDDEGRLVTLASYEHRKQLDKEAFRGWLKRRAKAEDPRVMRFVHTREPLAFYDRSEEDLPSANPSEREGAEPCLA